MPVGHSIELRNANTRGAYARAVGDFLAWCKSER
jgi:hypothetical protein